MEPDREFMLAELERVIAYTFRDRVLLAEALTHRSFANESGDGRLQDNGRLEFLGDAVIDLFLSSRLLERFPESREGELSRIRARLVDEEALSLLAGEIGLGRYLRLGRGEELSGGREKRSILADAYEALIAAVYLDGGADAVSPVIEAHFGPLAESYAAGLAGRDYKTEFQERAQALRGGTPRYLLKEASGPEHDRRFTVEVFLGEELMGEGTGRSKKKAEQAAARTALARLANPGQR